MFPALAPSPPLPIVGDHLENFFLLGFGFSVFVLALVLCNFIFDMLSKTRSAGANRPGRRTARRRRACLRKYRPPVRSSHLRLVALAGDSRAQNTLRRNAESHQRSGATSAGEPPTLRLVKPPRS